MQNTGGKKRAAREDVDSAYLFVNAKREIPKISNEWPVPTLALHNPFYDWSKGDPLV